MSMAIQRTKYTGDPGLFSFLGKVAKVGLGIASVVPGIGTVASIARRTFFPGDARVNIPGASTLPRIDIPGVIPQFPTAGPGAVPFRATDIGARPAVMPRAGTGPGCPPGMFKLPFTNKCVDPSAAALGGDPFITDLPMAAMNGMNGDPMTMRAGTASGWPGYHWNKSDYFLRSGEFVPAGSRSVKNRRRNPMNPRATSNAISRVKGAKRFASSLAHISIRKKC